MQKAQIKFSLCGSVATSLVEGTIILQTPDMRPHCWLNPKELPLHHLRLTTPALPFLSHAYMPPFLSLRFIYEIAKTFIIYLEFLSALTGMRPADIS